MKIHLLWCTLRPATFKKMHSEWMNRSSDSNNIITYVAVNWEEHSVQLRDYLSKDFLVTLNINKIGVCYPSYYLTSNLGLNMGKCESDDIVVFASDDFLPPNNWDLYLKNKLNNKGDVCLFVRDGYQLPDSSNMLHPVITIPIMTYGCLLKLNRIIYHPEYTHMFSDRELYDNLKDLNLLYDDRLNDETLFEHLHYTSGKRESDYADREYNSKWSEDERKWETRRKMNIEDRLKVFI
jgi:hypothetical protein